MKVGKSIWRQIKGSSELISTFVDADIRDNTSLLRRPLVIMRRKLEDMNGPMMRIQSIRRWN